jgi:hypothetical protein
MCRSNIVPAASRCTVATTCVMSNINCHRRKIIYSVRTPIIALQSWITRRIHTSMLVFDDIERNELGPRPYAQPDFIYLNAIG